MNIYIQITLICASALCLDNSGEGFRKHYGLSMEKCPEFIKSFRCKSACKSIGFQIFRLDRHCKCTCHELKTTTILPFFKWRTNGTTITYPRTQSPGLYHVVGTLSPATVWTPSTTTTETPQCVYVTVSNTTRPEEDGNSTVSGNSTEIGAGDNETNVETGGSEANSSDAASDGAGSSGSDGSSANDTTPDANNPDANNPDAKNPDANNPDANNPDANNPDAKNPDANNPDANNPDANNPDANNPDANNPDANNPDANNPDANNPDASNPDANNPDAITPDDNQG